MKNVCKHYVNVLQAYGWFVLEIRMELMMNNFRHFRVGSFFRETMTTFMVHFDF